MEEHGLTVVGIAADGARALRSLGRTRPDVVLVDLRLPDMSGIALGARILSALPETKVLALTSWTDPRVVREVTEAGFHGFLSKQTPIAELVAAIDQVMEGQKDVHHLRVARRGSDRSYPALLIQQLTQRECEVLGLLAEGSTSQEISQRLWISRNTVRTHVQNILMKLNVHSRLEAVAFAIRYGLVAGDHGGGSPPPADAAPAPGKPQAQ